VGADNQVGVGRSTAIEIERDRPMTTKEELRQLVDTLSDQDAADLLDYAHWLLEESDILTPEDMARVREGEDQIRRGEYVTLDSLKRELGR
jgi:hypothetical protein